MSWNGIRWTLRLVFVTASRSENILPGGGATIRPSVHIISQQQPQVTNPAHLMTSNPQTAEWAVVGHVWSADVTIQMKKVGLLRNDNTHLTRLGRGLLVSDLHLQVICRDPIRQNMSAMVEANKGQTSYWLPGSEHASVQCRQRPPCEQTARGVASDGLLLHHFQADVQLIQYILLMP